MRPRRIELAEIVAALAAGRNATFARWGDGELRAAFGIRARGRNADGHEFFPEMGAELLAVLRKPQRYYLGLQGFALRTYGALPDLLARTCPAAAWVDADVFHHAAARGRLHPLVAALRRLPVILAGPAHLHRLRDELNVKHVVAVPPRDCYRQWRRVADEILAAAAVTARPCVVSVSASMPAELIVDYAHERVGEGCSVIDFGSLWDPFVGMRSRRYHRGMTPATLRANLHGWD